MEDLYLNPYIALGISILGVLGYETSYKIVSDIRFIRDQPLKEIKSTTKEVVRRFSGFIFLGVIPICAVLFLFQSPITYLDLPDTRTMSFIYWLAALICFGLIVPFVAITQAGHLNKYPQMRVQKWDLQMILLNSLTWGAQLFAYELLFRGILLFSIVPAWGKWPAIIINGILYSLAHLPKGWKEAIGSFPFAILLCLASLATGSIWVAVVGHLTLALANDWVAVYKHPTMKFSILKTANK